MPVGRSRGTSRRTRGEAAGAELGAKLIDRFRSSSGSTSRAGKKRDRAGSPPGLPPSSYPLEAVGAGHGSGAVSTSRCLAQWYKRVCLSVIRRRRKQSHACACSTTSSPKSSRSGTRQEARVRRCVAGSSTQHRFGKRAVRIRDCGRPAASSACDAA